jgi:hypothetical protein
VHVSVLHAWLPPGRAAGAHLESGCGW